MVHPQKRRVLRHLLDGIMGRILELKNEMVLLEFSEYHYFDDVLSDLKLTPVSIMIIVRIGHLKVEGFIKWIDANHSQYYFGASINKKSIDVCIIYKYNR